MASEEAGLRAAEERVRSRFRDLPPEVVDEALREARARFDDSPVRDFVPILVERLATMILRRSAGPVVPRPRPAAEPEPETR